MSRQTGNTAEHIARSYLSDNLLQFITSNYYTKHGELDLVMLDSIKTPNINTQNLLVFIEVKYRKNSNYGHPIETITSKKQEKLIKTALHFIQNYPEFAKLQYRFDAVTIIKNNYNSLDQEDQRKNKISDYKIEWFKNIIIR